MSQNQEEVEGNIIFSSSHIKFEKKSGFPGRPAQYRMLVSGVHFGDVIAQRDKTRPKVMGKHPIIYRIVNDTDKARSTPDLGEIVRWMYQLKRTEGWKSDGAEQPDPAESESEKETEEES